MSNAGIRPLRRRHRKVSPKVQQRRNQLMQMRLAGVNDQIQLAHMLGVSQSTISKDLAVIDNDLRILAAQDRMVEKGRDLARIDAMIVPIWASAVKGDLEAQNMVLKWLNRRAAILGYDEGKGSIGPAFQQVVATLSPDMIKELSSEARFNAYSALDSGEDDDDNFDEESSD